MSNQLILPKTDKDGKPYLSYSQISKWRKSKRDYIRNYFFGEKDDNAGLQKYGDFGHKVGEAFENNDYSAFEPDEIEFLQTVPKYDQFEREVRLQMEGFYLVGYIDTNTTLCEKIADYKTGDISKKHADYSGEDYLQMEIYAAAVEQEYGRYPDSIEVFLIGRSGNAFNNEDLVLTKEFVTITREVNPEKIQAVKQLVQDTAEEISAYYTIYLKLNGLI
jgi:hypothetical protein